jgi:hypothetical protein
MKTTKMISLIAIVLTAVVLCACSEVRYTYYLENSTEYSIDSGYIDLKHHFKLGAGEVAGPFEGVHKPNLASLFSQPFFHLSVVGYSDADFVYENHYQALHDKDMIKDGETYVLNIANDSNYDGDVTFVLDIREIAGEYELAKN